MPNGAPALPDSAVRLFFVRGHPRSGTNWVGALLNLHPRVYCFGEFHFEPIREAIDSVQSHTWQITSREPVRAALDQGFQDLVRRCILTLRPRKPGAIWMGDRTPRGLRPLCAGAPHFLVVRDGRDVAVSWTFHTLAQPEPVQRAVVPAPLWPAFATLAERFRADPSHFESHPSDLWADEGWVRHLAHRWAAWTRADSGFRRQMESADPAGIGCRVHTVRYELLHADPERERRRMYEFLGLDPGEASPLSPADRTTVGFEREDPRSFYRHGAVGDWKRYATDNFRDWFKAEAGAALVELGYEAHTDW